MRISRAIVHHKHYSKLLSATIHTFYCHIWTLLWKIWIMNLAIFTCHKICRKFALSSNVWHIHNFRFKFWHTWAFILFWMDLNFEVGSKCFKNRKYPGSWNSQESCWKFKKIRYWTYLKSYVYIYKCLCINSLIITL